ncbi:MAG: hypothetical protein H6569_02540 [Lewinellaceae bacterium]|nr:hypothetical protein [Lewinellaceae bacterium]
MPVAAGLNKKQRHLLCRQHQLLKVSQVVAAEEVVLSATGQVFTAAAVDIPSVGFPGFGLPVQIA